MPVPTQDHPLRGHDLAIAGEGTALRPVRLADVPVLFGLIHGQEEVLRWLCWRGPEDVARLFDRYDPPLFGEEGGTFGAMLAVVDGAGAPLGECSLTFEGDPGSCELGYWLGAEHQGRGHGSRLVALAAELCVDRLGCRVVTASVKEGNERSLRALERAGFVRHRAPAVEAATLDPKDAIAWIATLTARAWRRQRSEPDACAALPRPTRTDDRR